MKVLLLDVRYFKNDTTLLGEAQWAWLEHELSVSKAQLNIIGSGVQVRCTVDPSLSASSHSHIGPWRRKAL